MLYKVYRSLLGFLEWEHNVYLSSSEEVKVKQGLLGGAAQILFQLHIQGTSLFVLPRILESEWRSRAEDGSADRHSHLIVYG